MQLRRLAALERKKIEDEYATIKTKIDFLTDLLAHPKKMLDTIAEELKLTMTQDCGIFRDEERLTSALHKVKELQERYKSARIMDKSGRFNTELLGAIETDHLLTFSEVVVASGLARTESRGAHYRSDYPGRDDENWLKHTMARKEEDEPKLSYKSVNIDWERFPPQERKY